MSRSCCIGFCVLVLGVLAGQPASAQFNDEVDFNVVPQGGNRPAGDGEFDWQGLVGGLIDAANQAGQQQQPQQYDYIPGQPYYNDQPQYYPQQPQYYPQQPQYYPQPQRPAVKNNSAPKKPAEKILPVTKNMNPGFDASGLQLTGAEQELMKEVAKDKAEDKLKELTASLGDAANAKAVKKELDAIQKKIDAGEAVTEEDIQKLQAAVEASKDKLPPGFDSDKVNKQADQVIKFSDLAKKLNQPSGGGGVPGGGGIPSGGPTDVIFFPGLPQDDMIVLPDGTVVVGTGGQGPINMVSMPAQDVFGVPVGVGDPVPDASGDVAKRVKDGVLLMNPAENGQAIEYVVANKNFSMGSGYTQVLPATQAWVIEFDRGGTGTAKYTLKEGAYAFGSSDKGWELFKQTFTVTIENPGEEAFNYNIDNTQCQLAGGQSKTHTSAFPILVRFDRGNGKEAQKKVMDRNAHYQIAVDPADGFWDMFPARDPATIADAGGPGGSEVSAKEDKKQTGNKARAARLRALMQQAGGGE